MERRKKQNGQADAEAVLKELLKDDHNSKCADCGARRPRYASITLGIFLCNRCYGLHRSVGAHITRTKCLFLDNWSAEELARMQSIGNAVAASYWLRNLPLSYIPPSANASDGDVEKWIRDKYEKKLFCDKDLLPPAVELKALSQSTGVVSYEEPDDDEWSPFISAGT